MFTAPLRSRLRQMTCSLRPSLAHFLQYATRGPPRESRGAGPKVSSVTAVAAPVADSALATPAAPAASRGGPGPASRLRRCGQRPWLELASDEEPLDADAQHAFAPELPLVVVLSCGRAVQELAELGTQRCAQPPPCACLHELPV